MSTEPLQPFHPPTSFAEYLPTGVSLGGVAGWFLGIVFLFWAMYTAVAVYHWFRYSHASLVAVPATIVHLCVSAALILFSLSGTLFL